MRTWPGTKQAVATVCRCHWLPHRQSHWIFMALPAQIMRLKLKQVATFCADFVSGTKCNLVYELRAKRPRHEPRHRQRQQPRQRFARGKMNLAFVPQTGGTLQVAGSGKVQATLSAANFLLSCQLCYCSCTHSCRCASAEKAVTTLPTILGKYNTYISIYIYISASPHLANKHIKFQVKSRIKLQVFEAA